MATTGGAGNGAAGAGSEAGVTGVGDLSYSDASTELDAIIEEFETGVIDVDRLVDQLERATEIVDELDRRLRRTRMQVEELVPRLEAIGQVEAIDGPTMATINENGAPDGDGAVPGEGVSPGLF
jgi:exodeoxyribonuclease VII small subunit